jgi:phospholipid-binding lipoprotein MlaA
LPPATQADSLRCWRAVFQEERLSISTGVAAVLVLLSAQPDSAAPPVPPPAITASQNPISDPAPAPTEPAAPVAGDAPAAVGSAKLDPPSETDASGAIVVNARPKNDPMMGVNTVSFELAQDVDRALVEPLAMAYKKALPKPARIGLGNFIRNISSPIVFINDLLQLKPGRAFKTLGRFVINSTVGVGGLIDVAKSKPFHLPYRHNGFANTLGYYGVKPGPYFFVPFLGPTTLRDLLGGAVDGVILPYGIGAPFNKLYYTIPNGAVRSLNRRVEFDCQLRTIRASADPYAAERAYYFKKREAEIEALHGRGTGPVTAAQCENEALGIETAPVASEPTPVPAPAPSN